MEEDTQRFCSLVLPEDPYYCRSGLFQICLDLQAGELHFDQPYHPSLCGIILSQCWPKARSSLVGITYARGQ
ncbi:hypothetical protein N7468_006798 [Penicillium chermesinum]|uniref:Uncharacterized protein n=1 Tax=Penicillium chermesinum TaxID=63820 RepID=A0A9W9TK11_9EURO|nr:uncharacterized protein N7468_006798 [Penicillium chermesinum]KAJ5225573.1 hypothetical protein N7468_006798 [Penicillium chermesinum]